MATKDFDLAYIIQEGKSEMYLAIVDGDTVIHELGPFVAKEAGKIIPPLLVEHLPQYETVKSAEDAYLVRHTLYMEKEKNDAGRPYPYYQHLKSKDAPKEVVTKHEIDINREPENTLSLQTELGNITMPDGTKYTIAQAGMTLLVNRSDKIFPRLSVNLGDIVKRMAEFLHKEMNEKSN